MISIAIDNVLASDMIHIEAQNFLGEQVDQGLDAFSHTLWVLLVLWLVKHALKVKVRVCHLKASDIELVLEEDRIIIDGFFLPEITPDLVSKFKNCFDDLLLI